MKSLILASQSPRRRELLAQLGYQFTCCPADIDETVKINETPIEYVQRLAVEKSAHIAKSQPETTLVLGSDTCVVYQNQILGKPDNLTQSIDCLSMLSGNTHQVLTAIAVVQGQFSKALVVSTDVTFKTLTKEEIINYWHTGEPQDKAGSYGIQGIAGQFVKHISGSYSAVVGLPLYETAQLLAEFSCPTPVQSI
ncbi:Maf family protein [Colwellia sp. 1_MG-2023]|uniref:Maf family protein n=1 Tax=Colwellia sp. 1_MG-2023 TaxID=3062649 RepID=UPI0026E37257|nr:Maf family protein [Colwellia sp. 1_MG-2023]MDO6444725.1 Maf family protein [Colwellia sp. 1_MG-2023]